MSEDGGAHTFVVSRCRLGGSELDIVALWVHIGSVTGNLQETLDRIGKLGWKDPQNRQIAQVTPFAIAIE